MQQQIEVSIWHPTLGYSELEMSSIFTFSVFVFYYVVTSRVILPYVHIILRGRLGFCGETHPRRLNIDNCDC